MKKLIWLIIPLLFVSLVSAEIGSDTIEESCTDFNNDNIAENCGIPETKFNCGTLSDSDWEHTVVWTNNKLMHSCLDTDTGLIWHVVDNGDDVIDDEDKYTWNDVVSLTGIRYNEKLVKWKGGEQHNVNHEFVDYYEPNGLVSRETGTDNICSSLGNGWRAPTFFEYWRQGTQSHALHKSGMYEVAKNLGTGTVYGWTSTIDPGYYTNTWRAIWIGWHRYAKKLGEQCYTGKGEPREFIGCKYGAFCVYDPGFQYNDGYDQDGDGYADKEDNCPDKFNPLQDLCEEEISFYIADIDGYKSQYSPGETIKLTVKGVESDGTAATSSEGYNVQYYTYKTTGGDYLQEYVPSGNYNAKYSNGYWYIDYWAPKSSGKYYTEVILYCSREDSKCGDSAAKDLEDREKLYFEVEGDSVTCTDSDGGLSYYKKGYVTGAGGDVHYDFCDHSVPGRLYEQYCTSPQSHNENTVKYQCPYGCSNGACKTNGDIIEESVKCVFSGSNSVQECYSEFGSCKGTNSCVVEVKGEKGKKITWKSTCGGYAYTIIDGDNDYAKFQCEDEIECDIKDVLEEGETKTYKANGVEYEILAAVIRESPRSVQFRVNGEYTAYLSEGTTEQVADGSKITPTDIIPNEAGDVTQDLVEFCLQSGIQEDCGIPECEYGDAYDTGERDSHGCPIYRCLEEPPGLYVKLDEKFKLVIEQSAKVVDYGYMKVTLQDINYPKCTGNVCAAVEPSAFVSVEMPAECEETPYGGGCTATGKEFSLTRGESEEVFGAKLSLLGLSANTATFIVKKDSDDYGSVDIEIYPVENTITYGEKAVYRITVTDKHAEVAVSCEVGADCKKPTYTYFIDVRNLPFHKEYKKQISLSAGESKSIKLVVRPYNVIAVDEEDEEAIEIITGNAVQSMEKLSKVEATASAGSASVMETATEAIASVDRGVVEPIITTNLYRSYKFNVRAKEKNNPRNQDIAYAVLNIKPEIPPQPPPFPGEEVEIKLYKGWNLISLPGKLIRFEKINLARKLIGFVYLKEQQRYVSLKDAEKILGDEFREYLARNSFWIYSYNDVVLKIKIDREISFGDIELKEGWNLVPVTEDMLGGYLSDIKGDCEFEKLYLWNAARQKWEKITENYQFSKRLLNYGFLVKVNEDCRLGGVNVTLTPPEMPE